MNLKSINWQAVAGTLSEKGFASIHRVLSADDCHLLRDMYPQDNIYRNTINMERYRFGRGEYRYFAYPLPEIIRNIRDEFYPPLSAVANKWMGELGLDNRYPQSHEAFIDECHAVGQTRPTPLILRYEQGGYNTLHQDLYGEKYFPFQVVFVLSEPGVEYKGGEFVLVEQIPRAQSRSHVLTPGLGDAIIFTTNFRSVKGSRGFYRAAMKHGISEVTSGKRFALGVIFHDAA